MNPKIEEARKVMRDLFEHILTQLNGVRLDEPLIVGGENYALFIFESLAEITKRPLSAAETERAKDLRAGELKTLCEEGLELVDEGFFDVEGAETEEEPRV